MGEAIVPDPGVSNERTAKQPSNLHPRKTPLSMPLAHLKKIKKSPNTKNVRTNPK